MSIAMERMTSADRQALSEQLLTEPKPFKGTEWGAHCPFHKEETPGGAFYYNFDQDMAYCHSCGANSDLVGIFNAVKGRDPLDPDGCAEFVERFCDPSKPIQHQPKRPAKRAWQPREIGLPPQVWMEKAAAFVEHAVERLQNSPERLDELEAWGIDGETALKCRFGWNDRDKWPPVTKWGLPHDVNEAGKEKKVWLPEGLVMPAVHGGKVVKLKIRRPDPITPWGDSRKYWEVKGGANHLFHLYGNPAFRVWVLVETERDAALVWRHAHDVGVGAIGTGGATKRPGGYVADVLGRAKLILNALDYDKAGAAGSYDFWEKEYPIAKRWPAPPSMGKDVGDAFGAGLDVRQWVLDGIPGFIMRKLAAKAEDKDATEAESVADEAKGERPVEEKPYYEQVLEWMEQWPRWKAELVSFQEAVQANGFRVFKGKDGNLWLGLADDDWKRLHADGARCALFGSTRQVFHELRELDPELGNNSLENIINHYLGDRLEVRG